jgi:fucose permease
MLPPLLNRRTSWDCDRDPAAPMTGSALAGIRTVLGNWNLIALSLLGFGYAGFQFTLLAFAVTMLVSELGWNIVSAGLTVSVMQLAGIGGRIAWSILADWSRRGMLVLAGIGLFTIVLGVGMRAMDPGWSPFAVTIYLFVVSWCSVGWNGVYMAEAARTAGPQKAGLATGGLLAFNFSGVILCPAVYALVSKANGAYAAAFSWFTVLPLIGMVGVLLADRRERRYGTALR